MSATREQILDALLAALSACAPFKLTSRRDRAPESIGPDQSPALFLLETGERYERPTPINPPKRTLLVDAVFYNDAGADPNAIPLAVINAALDALDDALASDNALVGRFTIGGRVYSCMIDGAVKKFPGAKTGKAGAIVPLAILLP